MCKILINSYQTSTQSIVNDNKLIEEDLLAQAERDEAIPSTSTDFFLPRTTHIDEAIPSTSRDVFLPVTSLFSGSSPSRTLPKAPPRK